MYMRSISSRFRKIKQDLIELEQLKKETEQLRAYADWMQTNSSNLSLEERLEILQEQNLILLKTANNEDVHDIIKRRLDWWKEKQREQRHRSS